MGWYDFGLQKFDCRVLMSRRLLIVLSLVVYGNRSIVRARLQVAIVLEIEPVIHFLDHINLVCLNPIIGGAYHYKSGLAILIISQQIPTRYNRTNVR
jgi:hypothetical protein